MTEAVAGLSLEEAKELFERLHELVTKDDAPPDSRLGKLAVFAGVAIFSSSTCLVFLVLVLVVIPLPSLRNASWLEADDVQPRVAG